MFEFFRPSHVPDTPFERSNWSKHVTRHTMVRIERNKSPSNLLLWWALHSYCWTTSQHLLFLWQRIYWEGLSPLSLLCWSHTVLASFTLISFGGVKESARLVLVSLFPRRNHSRSYGHVNHSLGECRQRPTSQKLDCQSSFLDD